MAKTKDRAEAGSANGTPAAEGGGDKAKKCEITREQWKGFPASLKVKVGDVDVVALKKDFASGSFGYYTNEKVTLVAADGTPVRLQANLCLTVVNSQGAV